MPLVLELAVARLRVLPLPRIVAWLDDAASLLVTTRRDVPARQATLRATLDWSHDLLPAPERELFAQLSVFRGGFTVAGAAAVAGSGATLDLLTRLVDKSLVQASTDGAEERYRLLEVARQYAADQLGDGSPAVSARHAFPEASGAELRNGFHWLKYLRRALGDAARLRYAGGAYHLDPAGGLHYDVEAFRTAKDAADTINALRRAADLYPGNYPTDVPVGGWAVPHRAAPTNTCCASWAVSSRESDGTRKQPTSSPDW